MRHVHVRPAANSDATTTALASPTRLGALTAMTKIAAIAYVQTLARITVTPKVKHVTARAHARPAVTRPAQNASV